MKTQTVKFGVIADVQYADKPEAEGRSYRTALKSLKKAASSFNSSGCDFVIQLGDLIDGGDNAAAELQKAAETFNLVKARKYHVLGNHDFTGLSRSTVMQTLQMPQPYYYVDIKGWRFVVLDTLDYAVQGGWPEDSQNVKHACDILDQARLSGAANAQDYNGAVGLQQLIWLDSVLSEADTWKIRVILFAHLPLMPPGEKHTAWNADKVVAAIEKHPSVKAYFCGHNHDGGIMLHNGIHYVTLPGAVNAGDKGAWTVVSLYSDAMRLRGHGASPSRMLPLD